MEEGQRVRNSKVWYPLRTITVVKIVIKGIRIHYSLPVSLCGSEEVVRLYNNSKLWYSSWHPHSFSKCKRINNNGPPSTTSLKSALLCKNSLTGQSNKTSRNSSKICLARARWRQNFLIHTAIGNNNSPLSRNWQHLRATVNLKALSPRPTSLQTLQSHLSSHRIATFSNRTLRFQCPLSSRRWALAAHWLMSSKSGRTTHW